MINNNSNSNKCLYIDNFTNILGETIFDETCAKNLICGETCNIVQLPKDYKFNNDDNVRNSIEDFFRLYITAVDIGCINDKIKTYIGSDLTMDKIFKEKQLSLSDLSPLTYKLIDNIYFASNISTNKSQFNNYAGFKLIKQRLENLKLNNTDYKLYYDKDYVIYMIKNNVTSEENLLNINAEEIKDKINSIGNYIENTKLCANDTCKISINSLIEQDMIAKLKGFSSFNNKFLDLKDDLSKNINIMKKLCETSIVIDLMLKYYDITNVNDLVNLFKNKNIDINKYNELKKNIITNVNNLTTTHFTKVEFLKYVSLDNI